MARLTSNCVPCPLKLENIYFLFFFLTVHLKDEMTDNISQLSSSSGFTHIHLTLQGKWERLEMRATLQLILLCLEFSWYKGLDLKTNHVRTETDELYISIICFPISLTKPFIQSYKITLPRADVFHEQQLLLTPLLLEAYHVVLKERQEEFAAQKTNLNHRNLPMLFPDMFSC